MEEYPYMETYPYETPPAQGTRQVAANEYSYPHPEKLAPLSASLQKQPHRTVRQQQAHATSTRMPKSQAWELVRSLKEYLVIGSIVSFAAFGWLALTHTTGVTANQATPGTTQPAQQPDSGGFFQQGGSNFGSGGSSQAPFTRSSTS